MSKEVFIQIGVTALRAPDGSFLPSVPLYAKVNGEEVDKLIARKGGNKCAVK